MGLLAFLHSLGCTINNCRTFLRFFYIIYGLGHRIAFLLRLFLLGRRRKGMGGARCRKAVERKISPKSHRHYYHGGFAFTIHTLPPCKHMIL